MKMSPDSDHLIKAVVDKVHDEMRVIWTAEQTKTPEQKEQEVQEQVTRVVGNFLDDSLDRITRMNSL